LKGLKVKGVKRVERVKRLKGLGVRELKGAGGS